jgi:hypothetical protein
MGEQRTAAVRLLGGSGPRHKSLFGRAKGPGRGQRKGIPLEVGETPAPVGRTLTGANESRMNQPRELRPRQDGVSRGRS